ncbi:hypothetical protein AB0J43_06160, partial [Nonomuraea fuscirosea]
MTIEPNRLAGGLSSVRLRATAAATLVVALALGAAALVLIMALRGTLESSADAAAARKVSAVLPYAETIELSATEASEAAEAPPGRAAEPLKPPARTEPAPAGVSALIRAGQVQLTDGTVARIADPDVLLTKRADAAENWAASGQYA